MKQAVKSTVLILLVALLSGCSSSPKQGDKPLAVDKCEQVYQVTAKLKGQIADWKNSKPSPELAKITLLSWAYSVIDNSECYKPDLIANARAYVAMYSK